jgi:hypothetical protein
MISPVIQILPSFDDLNKMKEDRPAGSAEDLKIARQIPLNISAKRNLISEIVSKHSLDSSLDNSKITENNGQGPNDKKESAIK